MQKSLLWSGNVLYLSVLHEASVGSLSVVVVLV